MGTVFRAHGFRFMIHTFDHEPAHVHVYGAGSAKVDIIGADGWPVMTWSEGMSRLDIRRVMREIAEQQEVLQAEWERIHG